MLPRRLKGKHKKTACTLQAVFCGGSRGIHKPPVRLTLGSW